RTWKRTTAKITYRRPRRPVVRIILSVRPASRPYDLRFMAWIVGMLLVATLALNAPSTAQAAPPAAVRAARALAARRARPGRAAARGAAPPSAACGLPSGQGSST